MATLDKNLIDKNLIDHAHKVAELTAKNAYLLEAARLLLESLNELFDLLEEHEPHWYLRGHYNHARVAIKEAILQIGSMG